MTDGVPQEAIAPRHSLFDDAQALLTGTLLVAVGLALLRNAGLVTGGTVGIAFVLHYATEWAFGALLFLVNLPFYGLALKRMGRAFTVKTVLAVSLLAALSESLPQWMPLGTVAPLFAALGGGLLIGTGFVVLFRHKASLGGLNVLVMWLQETRGWRAGKVQFGLDLAILGVAAFWIDASRLGLSIAAALAMNLALAVNHRPGRYVAF